MTKETNFSNLDRYMNQIMYTLATNENISRLLAYTDPSMYSKEVLSNPMSLRYTKIFPFGYVPDVTSEIGSYITIEFDNFRPSKGGSFMYGYIVLNVFSHEEIIKTNYGSRLLLLYSEINKVITELDIGVGRLQLFNGRINRAVKKPFSGHELIYKLLDFSEWVE